MPRQDILDRLAELQSEESELIRLIKESDEKPASEWPPKSFYWGYHILTGLLLGSFGAISSLAFNMVGSVITGHDALQIIRIYLTFPMGDAAFQAESSLTILFGVTLYIATGALYGIVFEVLMSKYFTKSPKMTRFLVATVLGLAVWIINFYCVLSWLQPALFGGNWIITMIPFWVAGLTHLAFAWTMLLIGEFGHFEATDYQRQAMVRKTLTSQ
jgi:hypothetical protein